MKQQQQTQNKVFIDYEKTPRAIEASFRKYLGRVNPHICLIDAAMSYFNSYLTSNNNKSKLLRKEASKHGHTKLYTNHLAFNDSMHIGYIAFLALIQSRADNFCNSIQNHPCLDQKFKSEAKGDFLRKTIYIILRSSFPHLLPSNPVKDIDFSNLIDPNHILLIDYPYNATYLFGSFKFNGF